MPVKVSGQFSDVIFFLEMLKKYISASYIFLGASRLVGRQNRDAELSLTRKMYRYFKGV